MKITIESPRPGEEEEIILRLTSIDEKVLKLIQSLKTEKDSLTGYAEDRIQKLFIKDIFYFEAVDNKVYAYAVKQVYEVHKKLYEIEKEYTETDFVRISKAVVVNISKITYIRPMLNGRFEAKLKNDEKVIISRQYVSALKEKLDI